MDVVTQLMVRSAAARQGFAKRKVSEIDEAALNLSFTLEQVKGQQVLSGQHAKTEIQPGFAHLWSRTPTLREFLTILAWIICFLVILAQEVLLWAVFFSKVVGATDDKTRFINYAMWQIWFGIIVLLRYSARVRSGDLRAIFDHAEIFIGISLIMVLSNNVAFYLHTPSKRLLFDLGFALIPEQPVHSWLRILGEVMTIALPVGCAFLTSFQSHEGRIKSFCDFFRIAGIAYFLRALTVPLTSLPGPAPHCRIDSENYHPPADWIEVVTQLQGMYGGAKSCGDLIFSGHTALTLTATLLFGRKLDRYWGFSSLRWAALLFYQGTILYLIIGGRKHYSIDVTIAVIVVSLAFCLFEHSWDPRRRPLESYSRHEILKYLAESAQEVSQLSDEATACVMLKCLEDETEPVPHEEGEFIC